MPESEFFITYCKEIVTRNLKSDVIFLTKKFDVLR